MPSKSKVFIGSSVEGLEIANAIHDNLAHDSDPTIWSQGVFGLSKTPIETLTEIINNFDFAILVFSPDDLTKIRLATHKTVRDNVIFELGLFIGKIGRDRTFIVSPDNIEFHIPSDLIGVTPGKYSTSRTDNMQAATATACNQIKKSIKLLGKIEREEETTEVFSDSGITNTKVPELADESKKSKDWFIHYNDKKYSEAILVLEEEIEKSANEASKRDLTSVMLVCQIRENPEEGVKLLTQYQNGNLENPDITKDIAWIYSMTGYHSMSIEIIDAELIKYPDDSKLLIFKSEILSRNGKNISSIDLLKNKKIKDEATLIKLCEISEEEDDKIEAFKFIHSAYLLNPNSEYIMYKFGRLAQDNFKHELALYLFNRLVEEYPKDTTYIGYLGNSCIDLGMNDIGLRNYFKASTIAEEKESWIIANIGNLFKNQNLFEEAKKYFKKSIDLYNDSTYSYTRMAELIKSQEDEKKKFDKHVKIGRGEASAIVDVPKEAVPKEDVPLPLPRRIPPPPPPLLPPAK